ncbi:MAG TPA: TRAP transporter large permease, partial [Chloroflexota bacterium]
VNGVNSFPLLAVPLFMLAGELMNRGGVTNRLVKFGIGLVGHITGGLANVVVIVNMIMAGMSGSAVADAAATGSVLIPAMKKAGYPVAFAAAIVGAAAAIGPIIPPSIPMVLIGSIAEISVARMFAGGFIPGVMIGIALMAWTRVIAKKEHFPLEPRMACGELLACGRESFFAIFMPLFVVGGIVSGATTPTEAAMLGVIYSLILGLIIYRELNWRELPEIFVGTAISAGSVMLAVGGATLFGWVATAEHLGPMIAQFLVSASGNNPLIIKGMMLVIVFVLGLLMEPIPALVLMVPILLPVANSIGMDPVHFGVLFTINITIAMGMPPVGLSLMLMSSISKQPMSAVARSIVPMVAVSAVVLVFCTYVPATVLWLPNLLMGVPK